MRRDSLPYKQPTPGERETAFVCASRQHLTLNGRYAHIPDVHLVKLGSLLDRRPPTRPSLQGRATVWVGASGMLTVLEDGWDDVYPTALTRAFANKVVGATPGDLTILTADTDTHVCVAVEAYDKRPPVEVEGRVRVHMRGAKAALADDGDARQAFLVIVYPGASERTMVLR
jgi:hypothetical protein